MSDFPKKFSHIDIHAVLKTGRHVHYRCSNPLGIDIAEYRRTVDAAFKAYGNQGTKVIGTPFTG